MEKYLISLLETNNRVIVPDLGAFIIRQQEPRELVFNDLLAFNDGMLTSHIKQQEGISMSKAQVKIEDFVDRVKKVLTKGDIYHLENLGYLKMDDSSKIEFSVTKFVSARAEVVSAATLSQEEDLEEVSDQPDEDIFKEAPTPEDEAPVEEFPEEEAPVEETLELEGPEEETLELEGPGRETLELEGPGEEDLVEEFPVEESPVEEFPEEESPGEEFPEEETLELEALEELAPLEEFPKEEAPVEEVSETATEDGNFTLEDQTAEIEVDASEDTPLIPDPEEPPFMIEEQEPQEEKKFTVVGTSQARLEAAAAAASDEEKKTAQESEQESISAAETSIPYYIERERRTVRIWPWVGGAAGLIIILLVAAWFFFPNEVNRILEGKSAETLTTEEQVSDNTSTPVQETTSSSEEETAAETGDDATQVVEEAVVEPEPEPETPPAGHTKKYYIVAGMFSSKTNAEDLVNTLKAKGYDAELFGRKNNLYAVSFSSHASRAAAVEEMSRIREQINPKAWLLYY
jgi:cell division septation protein DedD